MTPRWLQRLFAATYDPLLARYERGGLADLRRALLGELDGEVVEIGAGTGANLAHYGRGVSRVTAVEPSVPMGERAARRAEASTVTVEVVRATAERLPLPDASADVVVSTLVLCSVRDLAAAVGEARRVLRPGGRFVVLEHVAGEGRTLRMQRLLEPAWKPLSGGCHLTRTPLPVLSAAGFDTSAIRPARLPMAGPVTPGVVGIAIAP